MTALAESIRYSTLTSKEEFNAAKYNIDLKVIKPNDQIAFSTEVGTSTKESTYSAKSKHIQANEDTILNKIEGVIDRINGETVRVKLYPNNYVNLPLVIFESKKNIQQGQHIQYMIKKDLEGYRYQKIIAIEKKASHPEKEALLSLLNDFKYKHE